MNLLRRIERFLLRTGMPPTSLGRSAMNDPRFVFDLRRGRRPARATVARMAAWLDANEDFERESGAEVERMARASFASFAGAIGVEVDSRQWASALFSGSQHRVTVRLDGGGAGAAADSFLDGLGEREFDLRGHILADIVAVSDERGPGGLSVRLGLEALTVRAC